VTSPMTGLRLASQDLLPNHNLRKAISSFNEEHRQTSRTEQDLRDALHQASAKAAAQAAERVKVEEELMQMQQLMDVAEHDREAAEKQWWLTLHVVESKCESQEVQTLEMTQRMVAACTRLRKAQEGAENLDEALLRSMKRTFGAEEKAYELQLEVLELESQLLFVHQEKLKTVSEKASSSNEDDAEVSQQLADARNQECARIVNLKERTNAQRKLKTEERKLKKEEEISAMRREITSTVSKKPSKQELKALMRSKSEAGTTCSCFRWLCKH